MMMIASVVLFAIAILGLWVWVWMLQDEVDRLNGKIATDGLNAGLLAELDRKFTAKMRDQVREFERGIFSAVYDKPRHEMNELRFRIGELEHAVKRLISPPIKGLRRVPAKLGMVIDFEEKLIVYDGIKWREASEQEKAQVK